MKPKVRTSVYDHKTIDVVDFHSGSVTIEEMLDVFEVLMSNAIDSHRTGKGNFKIKIDRPLSNDNAEHRMDVILKNAEKDSKSRGLWAEQDRERDRITYERLKKQFEGE